MMDMELTRDTPAEPIPREVRQLYPRMRQIATIVYSNGSVTARDVQDAIPDTLTIYGIRTMLNRLTQKGILRSRPSGRHREIVYLPGILNAQVRENALARLVEDDFGGSYSAALQTTLRLMHADSH